MPVIAMTREMGSRGKDVAIRLAEDLGLSIIHHELVEHDVAGKLHARETTVHRYLEGRTKLLERLSLDRRSVALCTAEEVFALAERGDVLIRGWGGPQLLRSVPHVLCVRICASIQSRVRTMMARMDGWDERRARLEIERNDAAHARVLDAMSNGDVGETPGYDMVLDTDRLSVETCARLIEQVQALPELAETAASRAELTRLRVEAGARAAIDADARTHDDRATINVSFDPRSMRLTLSGAVRDERRRLAAEACAVDLPGVSEVRNELRAMSHYQLQ